MGTLFSQPERDPLKINVKKVDGLLVEAKELATKLKLPIETILEAYKIKEMERRNDLYLHNGDIFDEQLSGLGTILEELTLAIQSLKNDK